MSVMSSPHDLRAHEDHLRHLLDQRAARADLHGRFPSMSEYSDSPSVYSHPHFSPRPSDRTPVDANLHSFPSHSQHQHHSPAERSPMSDRERLNFPNESSLDLDDDPRSSNEYSVCPEDDESSSTVEEEESPGISMYGPKMRFHSRAPWELGDEDNEEQDWPEPSSSKRSGNKGDSGKKGWGLAKGSSEKRPSTDSSRSQAKGKQSFDTIGSFSNNGGALFALAQASMSSTSLAQSSPQPTLRDKLSLPRLRSRTPSNPKPPSLALHEAAGRIPPVPPQSGSGSPLSRHPHTVSPPELSPMERTFSNASSRSPASNSQYTEYSHPYANPDLTRRVIQDDLQKMSQPTAVPPRQPSPVGRSDSSVTLTETSPSSTVFHSQSSTTMSTTPLTSASSVSVVLTESSPPTRASGGVLGKGISAPILMKKGSVTSLKPSINAAGSGLQEVGNALVRNRDTRFLSGMNPNAFPGWGEMPASPSIKLISLEEAQAQARERSRSVTAHGTSPTSVVSGPSKPQAYGNEFDQHGQRTRSSSAGGVKGRQGSLGAVVDLNQRIPPLPLESPQQSLFPAGTAPLRAVVRKKSGFMRLFKDRERPQQIPSPPPMPLLTTDTFTTSSSGSTTSQTSTRSWKSSTHRVPVPSLSPSMLSRDSSVNVADSGSSSDSPSEGSVRNAPRERQLSARRNAPDLSIVTPSSMGPSAGRTQQKPSGSDTSSHGHSLTPTTGNDALPAVSSSLAPNSAPASATDFVALSLRPVSTLFSTGFADQLISPGSSLADSRPSLETDCGTPTTATTAATPLSPDFLLRTYHTPGEGKTSPDDIAREDQSAVIQALQEQIMTARRAWQRQIWELEGQVRDLKAEVDELRNADSETEYCTACGRGAIGRPSPQNEACLEDLKKAGVRVGGIVDRPRARTGIGSRFASGT